MGAYVVRRLCQMIVVLLGVSIIVFSSVRLLPGDPARMVAGMEADQETVEGIRRQLGLDQPLLVQYGRFISGAVQGDFGTSIYYGSPVADELKDRFPSTLLLAFTGMLVAVAVGVSTGALAAVKRATIFDRLSMLGGLTGVCVPTFWLGLMLILLFAVKLHWLPSTGAGTWKHLILPSLTLGVYGAGLIARLTRSSMLEVLGTDYIKVARAKGLAERAVIYKHAFRNCMIPIITVIGLQFGAFLGKAVVTESVFAWPGIARLIVEAVLQRDFPLIQGAVIWLAVTFSLLNLLVDLLYAYLDPRIRYS